MLDYEEQRFRARMDKALTQVRKILDNEKEPKIPDEVQHAYGDKYGLAEWITQAAVAGQINCFEALGVGQATMAQLLKWSSEGKSITFRMKAEERCTYDRFETRKEELPVSHKTEYKGFGGKASVEHKSFEKIDEWFWQFECVWGVFAYPGTDVEGGVELCGRHAGIELVTRSESTPHPASLVRPSLDLDATWLLHTLGKDGVNFTIDREALECRTPRRNPEMEAALEHFAKFYQWGHMVANYFTATLFPVQASSGLDLSAINTHQLFNPVTPLFEARGEAAVAREYLAPFLAEQQAAMQRKFEDMAVVFPHGSNYQALRADKPPNLLYPDESKLITSVEAQLCVVMGHAKDLAQSFGDGVDYIEDMLRQGLIAAIGKIVQPKDFAQYMEFHSRKLFVPEQQPLGFSYAVRRPEHYPEGTVAILGDDGDGIPQPIPTLVGHNQGQPMAFALDAATMVGFEGPHYVHAWLGHQFSGVQPLSLTLTARARQFSSFIMMVGTIAGPHLFLPKYAIMVQNKDELKLPILLETIPAAKAFKDAIESLSPEQQRFAQAYRSLQLEGTLFAVCLIQVKPALEQVLNLPEDSLTKEIKLTQQLSKLFTEYQIPPDLLSFRGDDAAPTPAKLAHVKRLVAKMEQMVERAKDKELEQAKLREEMRRAEELARAEEEARRRAEEEAMRRAREQEERMAVLEVTMMEEADVGPEPKKKGGIRSRIKSRRARKKQSSVMESLMVEEQASAGADFAKLRASLGGVQPAQELRSSVAIGEAAGPGGRSEEVSAEPEPQADPTADTALGQAARDAIDYTKIPALLDQELELLDEDAAVRPTTLKVGKVWTKHYHASLLSDQETKTLDKDQQRIERGTAMDLIDALSKSGALLLPSAELHIVLASSHCFDKSLLETVVQDNVNPIEKAERSMLIIASTILGRPVEQLIAPDQIDRVREYNPALFETL